MILEAKEITLETTKFFMSAILMCTLIVVHTNKEKSQSKQLQNWNKTLKQWRSLQFSSNPSTLWWTQQHRLTRNRGSRQAQKTKVKSELSRALTRQLVDAMQRYSGGGWSPHAVFPNDRRRQTGVGRGGASYGLGCVGKRLVEGDLNLSLMEKEANGHSKP